MDIKSALQTGVLGVQRGFNSANQSAAQIASKDTLEGKTDLAKEVVDLKMSTYQVQASAKVIQRVDEALGTLLDEKA